MASGPCIAPHQKSEAVLEDDEHGAVLGLIINIVSPHKIVGAKRFRSVIYSIANIPQYNIVTLLEKFGDLQRSCGERPSCKTTENAGMG